MNAELIEILKYWIAERESIREKKERGAPKHWTTDPILLNYRFCNVRREDDRVTRWFRDNWRSERYWGERNFVPAIMLGRIINWPDTLEELGFPFEWQPDKVLATLDARMARGEKVYTGAYNVPNIGRSDRKAKVVVDCANVYFSRIPPNKDTLAEMSVELQKYQPFGPFLSAQVVADLKETVILHDAPDWNTWAILGPGSRRGLNRLLGNSLDDKLRDYQVELEFNGLRERIAFPYCLQDLQNCLCEFDKYMRVKNGEGKPRSSYPGV